MVDLEEFDSTLYFLDESEINHVATEVEDEYKRDVRASALNILFDLVELEGDPVVRGEIIGILESLFPNFLNARDFRTAALMLREAKLVASRAPGLAQDQHQRLDAFVSKLSEPAIVSQLVQSLDEVSALANEPEVAEVLRELRQTALEPVLTWIPSLSSPELRGVLEGVVDRLAGAHTTEVLRILRTPSSEALVAVIALCGRLVSIRPSPDSARPSPMPIPRSGSRRCRRSPSSARRPRSASWTRRSRTPTAGCGSRRSAWSASAATRARSSGSSRWCWARR